VAPRGDVAGGVDREEYAGVAGSVLRGERRHEHRLAVGVRAGQEVLVEEGEFHQRRSQRVAQERFVAGDLVVLKERVEEPVRAAGPAVAGEAVVEVEHVPVLAVRPGGRVEATGAVEVGGVGAPVIQLAEDQIEEALHGLGEVEGVAARHLEVDVGVGGEVVGPGTAPGAGP
jgi:hypothetical protein